jgi:TonB-dependent starch-binding outer membrane protein SusC
MKKLLLLFLGLFCIVSFSYSQNRQVKGKVTDDTGSPVMGANVQLKGTQTATQTDVNGDFSIQVPATGNPELIISSVGLATTTVSAKSDNLDIKLQKNVSNLDDVVVIGYGTAKRRDLTGTVSSIGAAELSKIPVSSAAEAITGRLAGVQVTTTDGAPGAEIVIRVRGGGSVTQDNSPLYIVDGFPVSSINDIAPADIASIDILKDAGTAAIYGARGANGVVIITTKSAKGGKTVVSYNAFGQARTLPKKLKVLSPYEFVLAQYEYARTRSQADVDNFTKYFGVYEDLELYKYQKGTDWQEELFGNPAYSQQHNVSVTGGSERTKFSLSATNNTDDGLLKGSGYMRNYLNLKINHDISPSLRLDFATRFVHTVIDGAGSSGGSSFRISDAITTRPVNGIADAIELDPTGPDDDYEQFLKSLINPNQLVAQDYRKRVNRTLNMNIAASWTIIKDLVYRSEFGLDLGDGQVKRYYGPLTGESRNVGGNLPLGEITNSDSRGYRWTNTLNYVFKNLGKHNVAVLGGQEMLVTGKGFSEFNRAKFFAENITPEKLFATMTLGTQDRHSTIDFPGDKIASFFGRISYDYNSRYLFSFTARADGSTKFAPGHQWGFFPAANFAWRISNEEFMSNTNFVNDLKLRLTYGQAGNNRLDNDLWRVIFAPSDNRTIGFGDVSQPYYTYASSLLPNPEIKWETTVTRNAGLDFSLFGSKLSGALDLYWNTTKDLLVETDIPQTTGFTRQQQNIGQTSNKGIELTLNASVINKKDFQLNVFFNAGMNRAKIDNLGGLTEKSFNSNWAGTDLKTIDDYRVYVGQTIGLMYGYVTDGMYTTDDFESFNPTTGVYKLKEGVTNVGSFLGGLSLRPGVLKLKDLNGDTLITAADRTVIGSALPKYLGGFGFNAIYKNFDFSAFFNWVTGNDVYNSGKISFNMLYRTSYGNMLNTMNSSNRYKYIDANGNLVRELAELDKLNANATIWSPFSSGTAAPVFHSWAVEDGSFLRLNNISIGYSLPKRLISKLAMTKFRIYATVYNAFLWTKYSGYDPEVSATRNSAYSQLTPGVDYSGYPKSRNYTLGVNVTF